MLNTSKPKVPQSLNLNYPQHLLDRQPTTHNLPVRPSCLASSDHVRQHRLTALVHWLPGRQTGKTLQLPKLPDLNLKTEVTLRRKQLTTTSTNTSTKYNTHQVHRPRPLPKPSLPYTVSHTLSLHVTQNVYVVFNHCTINVVNEIHYNSQDISPKRILNLYNN